ncbi:biofilm formation regulatory protein BssS [Yersinia aldovae]|nr:biofilm formation regulatory protein BssS [Yersinia aldovae]
MDEKKLKALAVNYGLKMSHSYALKVRHFKTGFWSLSIILCNCHPIKGDRSGGHRTL